MYNSLDVIPVRLFFKVLETENYNLIDPDNELKEFDRIELWNNLYNEYLELDDDPKNKRNLRIQIDHDYYILKYKFILLACDALSFDWDDGLIEDLREYGYKISKENYYKDLERAVREANGLQIKAEFLKKQLPNDEIKDGKKVTIDEILASYSLILGFDLDYEKVVVTKYLALKKQVGIKVKNVEEQARKAKAKQKR